MNLIDVIPIYRTGPIVLLLIIIGLIIGIIGLILVSYKDNVKTAIVGIIGLTMCVIGLIFGFTGVGKIYDHDEYVIELTNMSASEFYSQYEPVKAFEYSNAIQVKKKDGIK